MADRLLPTLALLALALGGLWLHRRRLALHPLLVALVATAVIGSFYPLVTLLVEPATWHNVGAAGDAEVAAVQADYAAFCGGLLVAFALLARAGGARVPAASTGPSRERAWLRHRDLVVTSLLLAGGATLYGLYLARVGLGPLLNRENLAEKHMLSAGLGPLLLGKELVLVACFWAEASERPGRLGKLLFRAVALTVAAWSLFFLSSRGTALLVLLGYLYVWCARREIPLRRIRPSLVLLLLVAWAGMEAFARSRGTAQVGFVEALTTMHTRGAAGAGLARLAGGSELAHPFYTSLELLQTETPGDLDGRSYAQAFAVLLPLFLDPDRPVTLAQDFAAEHYPELADRGGGAAFSLVGEAWWNFGPITGPLLLGLLLGALLALWDDRLRARPWGVVARLTPFLLFDVAFLHRHEAASLLKHTVFLAVPVGLAWLFARLVWLGARRGAGAPPRPSLPFPEPTASRAGSPAP